MLSRVGIPVVDDHSHYFTADTMRSWLSRGRTLESFSNRTKTRTDMTSIELPDENWDAAQRWVDELDRYGVEAMGVMVGSEAYDEFLKTVKRFPGRFIGYANINPAEPDAADKVRKAVQTGGSHKVLFGTDSTFFPRGWRINVLEAQHGACKELVADGVLTDEDVHRIFYGNILKLTGFKPSE